LEDIAASTIMKNVAKGDENAFRELYEQFGGYVFKSVVLSLRDYAVAEELAQTIWLKIWRFAKKYDPSRPFKPWLSRIISNELISHYRSKKPVNSSLEDMQEVGFEPVDNNQDSQETMLQKDLSMEIEKALDSLTDNQRQVIVLKYYQGLKIREIAETLSIGESAVKARLYGALEALSEMAKKAENG